MPLNLEPVRTGVAMVWQDLDERERMLAVYFAVWLVLALLAALRGRDRQRLKREVLEELHAGRES